MGQIRRIASIVVWRGFGFCWLAIAAAMSGLIFDLSLACRIGALLGIIVALGLQLKAETYHLVKRIDATEVWILLSEEARPSKEIARGLIVAAMRDELREKALYSAIMGGGLFVVSFALRMLLSA
jgi:hypothetical protein